MVVALPPGLGSKEQGDDMTRSAGRWSRRSPASATAIAAVTIASVAVAALAIVAAAAITTSSVLASPDKPPELRLPQDIVYDKAKDSPGPVTFSHATHVAIADNRCTGCHPAPFRMLKPARRVTHDDMNAGRACGICHDGRSATGVQDDCEHCHRAPAPDAGPAASKGGGS